MIAIVILYLAIPSSSLALDSDVEISQLKSQILPFHLGTCKIIETKHTFYPLYQN